MLSGMTSNGYFHKRDPNPNATHQYVFNIVNEDILHTKHS